MPRLDPVRMSLRVVVGRRPESRALSSAQRLWQIVALGDGRVIVKMRW
jgi:hypothetical protein